MRINIRSLLICLGVLIISGCGIKGTNVSLAAEISKKEAITLAQKYLNNSEFSKDYNINKAAKIEYDKNEKSWVIYFSSKYGFFSKEGYKFHLAVRVSAVTGEIAKEPYIVKW